MIHYFYANTKTLFICFDNFELKTKEKISTTENEKVLKIRKFIKMFLKSVAIKKYTVNILLFFPKISKHF